MKQEKSKNSLSIATTVAVFWSALITGLFKYPYDTEEKTALLYVGVPLFIS